VLPVRPVNAVLDSSVIRLRRATPTHGSAPGKTRSGALRALAKLGCKTMRRAALAVAPESVIAWHGRAVPAREGRRPIALTFDDGPDELTREYLKVLAAFKARATFFVVGELCAARPDLVSAIAEGGHELAGHGYTHRRFPSLRTDVLRDELLRTEALLPRTAGRRLVRPPYGALSVRSLVTCARAGFTTALWSHESEDWRIKSADDVCAGFGDRPELEPGAVLLLHEGQPWTVGALPMLLSQWSEAGHDLVTMGELLDR
jgi:peptidoglycan/xylan/chitin deacetylase (PgdA/CDA1 family)